MRKFWQISVLCALGALALPALPVAAEQRCDGRAQMAQRLFTDYSELPFAAAIDGAGNLIEIYRSSAFGTWTVTLTEPGGAQSCIVASGNAFEVIADGRAI